MSPVLGDLWPDFLAHASLYKPAFLAAFDPPSRLLSCVGKCNGCPCDRAFVVDLSSPSSCLHGSPVES